MWLRLFSFRYVVIWPAADVLFRGDRLVIRGNGCCIIAIAIATGFRLKQFSTHVAGAFPALGRAAMEAEYFRRTRSTAFFGSASDVFFP